MNKEVKFFIGPMSKNIVESVCEYSNDTGVLFGLIPSRRQVEYSGGYVNNWTTEQFTNYTRALNKDVLLQRDHAGAHQGNTKDNGIESLTQDCKSKFDLIHIDPWKKSKSLSEAIEETCSNIDWCLGINPLIKFEIGTEAAIREYTPEEFEEFVKKVKSRLGNKFENVKYGVIQGGTAIVGNKNIGVFDYEKCKKMIKICNKFGILSKEHNGDYLLPQEIVLRFECGLSAINIAPEFGYIETQTIMSKLFAELDYTSWEEFYKTCYESNRWIKWFPQGTSSIPKDFLKTAIINASGHYIFSTDTCNKIKRRYPDLDGLIKLNIKKRLAELSNQTTKGS